MSKTVKILVVFIAIIGIGYWLFPTNNTSPHRAATSSPETSNQSVTDIPSNWQRYKNANYDFTISHPPEATIQAEGINEKNNIKFMYLGSSQATGEITDGFTLTVSTHHKDKNQAKTLEEFVDDETKESSQAGEVLQEPQEASFHDRTAWQYQVESLGTVNVTAVETSDAFVTISSNVTDPNDRGYAEMVKKMKASLEFKSMDNETDKKTGQQESVDIAVLDMDIGENKSPARGCDNVKMISRSIADTNTPLNAAMHELFSLKPTDVEGYYNFMAKTNSTLSFDRATIEDETANIYLSGELSGLVGVCDNPRAKIQIEETALQFPTVSDVQIHLNGEATELQPGGRN